MRTIGWLTTLVLAVGLAVVGNFAWRSRGDLQRYLKMRSM
jgi:hypothetical protein